MPIRKPGYYWITWTDLVDADLAARRPGPLIGQWDGKLWWFVRSEVYRFDCEVKVLEEILTPPEHNLVPRQSANFNVVHG
jgi:hypothetical protein